MDYIKVKGKDFPFWYALKANREMSKVKDLAEKDDVYFIWLGLKYGALREGLKFELKEQDVVDAFDDNLEEYAEANKVLNEQLGKLRRARLLESPATI